MMCKEMEYIPRSREDRRSKGEINNAKISQKREIKAKIEKISDRKQL